MARKKHSYPNRNTKFTLENPRYKELINKSNRQKNLIRDDEGNYINQWGVKFTEAEKKALESSVTSVNRKRKRQLEALSGLSRKAGGKDTGDTIKTKMILGDESEFILAKRSKSLQRFESRKEYTRYMTNLKKAMSADYELERMRLYKRNYMAAMEKEFGDPEQWKDIRMKIRMMKPQDFVKLVNQDDAMEIKFVYDAGELQGRLNQIRGALGINLKDDEIEDI